MRQHQEAFVGRLFSTLRLPILTNHPVHIHGLFSITPDRGRLTSSGQVSGSDDFATKWHDFLFASCVSSAWTEILHHQSSTSCFTERFSLWPKVTEVSINQWDRLDDHIIDMAIENRLPTLKKCVTIQQGFFSETKREITKYAAALAEAGVAVIYLEQPLFEKLQHRTADPTAIMWTTSKAVRTYLHSDKTFTLLKIPRALSALLLEYCLSDLQHRSDDISRKRFTMN